MDDKVNLEEKIALLDGHFKPGIVGYLNDYKLVAVRVKGEFVWHQHDDTDDFFLVLSGRLTVQLRDRDVVLEPRRAVRRPGRRRAPAARRRGDPRPADRAARHRRTPATPAAS